MSMIVGSVLSTRAQYARIKSLYQNLNKNEAIEFNLIVTGGSLTHRFGNLVDILDNDGIQIYEKIPNLIEGGDPVTQAKTTGIGLLEYATAFRDMDPDIVVTTGDRYETMATMLAASYLNIPVAHLEGGELTGSIDDKVRHASTKMADYHFVSTERSAQIVEQLGESSERIFHSGCPSIDLCKQIFDQQNDAYDPQEEYGGVGDQIDVVEDYIVFQFHPLPTEYGTNYEKTKELLAAYDNLDIQAFWFWPNMDAGTDEVSKAIREYRERQDPSGVRFFINLEPHDYLTLVNNAACVVGNSSVGIRECSYFGTPTVNIGPRQQSRERAANVTDVRCDSTAIVKAIRWQLRHGPYTQSDLYGSGNAGEQITEILTDMSPKLKEPMTPSQFELEDYRTQIKDAN